MGIRAVFHKTKEKTRLAYEADKRYFIAIIAIAVIGLALRLSFINATDISLDEAVCMGENCGCNRLCTRIFKCPGLVWDPAKHTAGIDEVICTGCGVCESICPAGAIRRKEAS